MRATLSLGLLMLGCAGLPSSSPDSRVEPSNPSPCVVSAAEVWATDLSHGYTSDHALTSAETVRRAAEIHISVKSPIAAGRLAAKLDRIVSRSCQEAPSVCERLDAALVARLSGANGCERVFVASRFELVDITTRRFGTIGGGFRNVFALGVERNCDALDAVVELMRAEQKRGVVQTEERESAGPLNWAGFKRMKPELAGEVEKDLLPLVDKRPFYYVRIGRKAEAPGGSGWTSEGLVTRDDCALLKLPSR